MRKLKLPLKTAIAATICLLAYQLFHMSHGYWAVVSAVIVTESNLGRSLLASTRRLTGTAVGALVGAAVYWAVGRNAAAFFLAVALTLIICVLSGLQDSMRLAGVTVTIVMLIGDEAAWRSGMNRFIDVALGVIVAVLVSVIWPSRARNDLRRSLASTYDELRTLFELVTACYLKQECNEHALDEARAATSTRWQRNAKLVADVKREPGTSEWLLVSLTESANRMRDHIYGLDYSARNMGNDQFHLLLEPELRDLVSVLQQAFASLTDEMQDHPPTAVPSLDHVLEKLESAFDGLRQNGVPINYSSDELLKFYSLLYRLRYLVNELDRSLEFANALEHSS